MIDAPALTLERLRELRAALPGKVSTELVIGFPCEGQVSLCWWDRTADSLGPDEHHLEGFDFKIIHDEGETDLPIWQFLAQAVRTADLAEAQAQAYAELKEQYGYMEFDHEGSFLLLAEIHWSLNDGTWTPECTAKLGRLLDTWDKRNAYGEMVATNARQAQEIERLREALEAGRQGLRLMPWNALDDDEAQQIFDRAVSLTRTALFPVPSAEAPQ